MEHSCFVTSQEMQTMHHDINFTQPPDPLNIFQHENTEENDFMDDVIANTDELNFYVLT